MKTFLHLAFVVALFAATIASESLSSDLLKLDGDGWYSWQVEGPDELEIHALIKGGKPVEFRMPGFECSHRDLPDSESLGVVSAAESVNWLRRFVDPRTSVGSQVLFVITAHDDDTAFAYIDHLLSAED